MRASTRSPACRCPDEIVTRSRACSKSLLLDGVSRPLQPLPEVRMGDGRKTAGALGKWLAFQLRRAEFRNDDIHVAARRGDGAGEALDDPADAAAARRCGQHND